jgi:hypothetical protein
MRLEHAFHQDFFSNFGWGVFSAGTASPRGHGFCIRLCLRRVKRCALSHLTFLCKFWETRFRGLDIVDSARVRC